MASTANAPEIELPELTLRPWGKFVDVVPTVDMTVDGADRTAFGAKFMADGTFSPIIVDFNCDTEDAAKTGNMTMALRTAGAVQAHNVFQCSDLSGDMSRYGPKLRDSFRDLLSEALTFLATNAGTTPTTIDLATESTALAAATSPTDAIGLIEDALGERISNYRGHIFVPLRQLAAAMAAGAVRLMDGRLVSPAGHYVISDAGHVGDTTFFGTGAIGWSATDATLLGDADGELDRTRNIREWIVENWLLVVFNQAHSVRTTLTG